MKTPSLLLFSTLCLVLLIQYSCSKSADEDTDPNVPKSSASLLSVVPKSGYTGDEVHLVGTNFGTVVEDVEVIVNDTKATLLSVQNFRISITMPASASWINQQELSISLRIKGKVVGSKPFTFSSIPTIQEFIPSKGIPGQDITIKGKRFGTSKENFKVLFGTSQAVVKSVEETSIVAQIPDNYKESDMVKVSKASSESESVQLYYDLVKYDSLVVVNPDNWYDNTQVRSDVVWKSWRLINKDASSRDTKLFGKVRSINVLEIRPDAGGANTIIGFDYLLSGYKKTSKFCTDKGAIVGLNGPYYETSTGGICDYLRVDGVQKVAGRTSSGWAARLTGALAWTDKSISIMQANGNSSGSSFPSVYKNLMICGPVLLLSSNVIPPKNPSDGHVADEHPRTAVGTTKDGTILFVTVDGRFTSAVGMSTSNLALLMRFLGASDAINLDGGGSTTMWVKGQADNGIVNYPSDNAKFDHLGERTIGSGALYVK